VYRAGSWAEGDIHHHRWVLRIRRITMRRARAGVHRIDIWRVTRNSQSTGSKFCGHVEVMDRWLAFVDRIETKGG